MTTFIVATDGSDLAIGAAVAGLALTRTADKVLVVAVADLLDPSLAEDATGHAGATMTPQEIESQHQEVTTQAREALEQTAEALRGLQSPPTELELLVVEGDPGPALCELAAEMDAAALIVGSRGRGVLKRAFLGSVSDYVVRKAPCSVIVSRDAV